MKLLTSFQQHLTNYYNFTTKTFFNILLNYKFDLNKKVVVVISGNSYQIQSPPIVAKYFPISLWINLYNSDTKCFCPNAAGLDPANRGWKFFGNPEMEIRKTITGNGGLENGNTIRVY